MSLSIFNGSLGLIISYGNDLNKSLRSEAFAAAGFNKIFSGNQPRQMNKRNRRFENHLGLHYQRYDVIPDPTVPHIYIAPQAWGLPEMILLKKSLFVFKR
jgi:hypothetical protein